MKRITPAKVTMTMAKNLYMEALCCRENATGAPARDPVWEDTHYTYKETWLRLAKQLVRRGWQPRVRARK